MKLLVSKDVCPYMCQVALEDVAANDYPVPDGNEAVFRTATTIAVATRSDWVFGRELIKNLGLEYLETHSTDQPSRPRRTDNP